MTQLWSRWNHRDWRLGIPAIRCRSLPTDRWIRRDDLGSKASTQHGRLDATLRHGYTDVTGVRVLEGRSAQGHRSPRLTSPGSHHLRLLTRPEMLLSDAFGIGVDLPDTPKGRARRAFRRCWPEIIAGDSYPGRRSSSRWSAGSHAVALLHQPCDDSEVELTVDIDRAFRWHFIKERRRVKHHRLA